MTASPRDLIHQGRWHSALFTTYSLSLSFFESYLLRDGLKKSGCREIWVVADIDGYHDSLAERQSRFVGQDYRLVPVAMPHGVFHPKCTYLSGPDGDLLIIGSGNLTFGGYGKNIEVFEAFRGGDHPEVFAQFAAFLNALRKRSDFINPDDGWLDRFERLAQAAGAVAGSPGQGVAELVHSVEQTILDQLHTASERHGGAAGARLLSPYFDPDAEAVVKLSTKLAVSRPVIGLVSGQESRSGFPFGKDETPKVKSAIVEVERPRRKLHAKWIEIDLNDGKQLTLTGSINATRQALCSTNNIEVGVLRAEESDVANRIEWKKSSIPTASAMGTYLPPGLGSRALLHARLAEDGRLVGQLFSAIHPMGTWRGVLSRADGHSAKLVIEVDAHGHFGLKIDQPSAFERATGLQLHISNGSRNARCWVQNDWLIEVAQITDLPTAALLSLFRGEATDQDEIDFLGFLTEGIAELAPQLAAITRQSERPTGEKRPREVHVIAVEDLAPREADDATSSVTLGETRGRRVSQMLNRLVRQFEESGEIDDPASRSGKPDDDELSDDEIVVDTEEVEDRRTARKTENSLVKLREVVKSNLRGALGVAAKRAMLGLWLVVELRMRLRGDEGVTAGRRFVREWLLTAATASRWGAHPDSIDEKVLIMAAILGATETDDAAALVGVHEALEDYRGASTLVPELISGIRVPPLFARLIPSPVNLVDGLKAVLGARTRRQEIEMVRAAVAARVPLGAGLSLLSSSDGRLLQEALTARRPVRFEELKPERSACPKCNMALRTAEVTTIRRMRFGRCVQCETFLFDSSVHS